MIHNSYIWLKINVVFYIKSIIFCAYLCLIRSMFET